MSNILEQSEDKQKIFYRGNFYTAETLRKMRGVIRAKIVQSIKEND